MNGSTTEGAQGICATGWHIPSSDDFEILKITSGTQLHVGGGSGFEALAGGYYSYAGSIYGMIFDNRGVYASFWSSTSSYNPMLNQADVHFINIPHKRMTVHPNSKPWNFSVRCLKD